METLPPINNSLILSCCFDFVLTCFLLGIQACSALLSNQDQLEHLFISNNGLDTAAAELIAELLLFRKPTKLKTLHIVNNLLRDGGGIALASILQESPDLEDLRLSATRIGTEGSLKIVKALHSTANLRHLDLADSNLEGEGSIVLAQALLKQKDLVYLNLGGTGTHIECVEPHIYRPEG